MDQPQSFRRSYLPWWIEIPLSAVAHLLYRVSAHGMENIPATGGALLLCNHISYVDVVALQMAVPRPLRFGGFAGFTKNPILRVGMRLAGVITISSAASLEGTRRIVESLKKGELVCLFPEGGISRTGHLLGLRRGFELMAKKSGAPVIPIGHDGLWGSIFSYSETKYFAKGPRLKRTSVAVCCGQPIAAGNADLNNVRQALLDLGAEAFALRPLFRRHVGRETVRALAKRPRRTALIDRTAERRELSAARLLGVSAALATRWKNSIQGTRVGIVLPPGAGAVIANLAVICAGKIPVNLNFTAGKSAVEAAMRIGGITTLISANVLREKLTGFPWLEDTLDLKAEIESVGKKRIALWMLAALVAPNQWVADWLGLPKCGGDAEVALLFTSGSSGEPKGVSLSHRNVLANCAQISSTTVLPDTGTMLGCLPIFHSFGFTVTLWYCLIRGIKLVTVPSPLETKKIVDAIRDEAVTIMIGAPTFLRPLLKRAEPADLRTLSLLVSGAEKMPIELYESFRTDLQTEIFQGYGLTETSPVISVNQPDAPPLGDHGEFQQGEKLGSVGRPLPGIALRIVDPDTRNEIPLTETGLVLYRGANVFGGYLDDPVKTRAAFHQGWFVSGDLGRIDRDGFLFVEGRLSRFSKIGGEMVPHGTIEEALIASLHLDQSEGPVITIVGIPDDTKGEAIVLLTTKALTLKEVRDTLATASIPNLWIPKSVLKIEKIPLLGTGKLDLKTCRMLAMDSAKASRA